MTENSRAITETATPTTQRLTESVDAMLQNIATAKGQAISSSKASGPSETRSVEAMLQNITSAKGTQPRK